MGSAASHHNTTATNGTTDRDTKSVDVASSTTPAPSGSDRGSSSPLLARRSIGSARSDDDAGSAYRQLTDARSRTPSLNASALLPSSGHTTMSDSFINSSGVVLPSAIVSLHASASAPQMPQAHLNYSSSMQVRVNRKTRRVETINDIRIGSQIGRGSYGRVFRATCDRYRTYGELAVKEVLRTHLPSTPTQVELPDGSLRTMNLPDEACFAAQLGQHPSIVPVLEVIDDASTPSVFLVMPSVNGAQAGTTAMAKDGATAKSFFACTQLPDASLEQFARDMLSALRHCRERGVVHGDIKPENVLLEDLADGGDASGGQQRFRAQLIDFGLATTTAGRNDSSFVRSPSRASLGSSDARSSSVTSRKGECVRLTFPTAGAQQQQQTRNVSPSSAVSLSPYESQHHLHLPSPAGSFLRSISAKSVAVSDRSALDSLAESQQSSASCQRQQPLPSRSPESRPSQPQLSLRDSASSPSSKPRVKLGTPAFRAPELALAGAQKTPASDVWSLGVMLFGLKYGYLPYYGSTPADLAVAMKSDLKFPPIAPRDKAGRQWRALICSLLSHDPEERLRAAHDATEQLFA